MTAVTLRRYTNLAATIHLLRNRVITLLNPASWDDRNDAYFMSQYKSRRPAQSLLALCFAETSETYHHWRVFSHGSDGVCLEFDKHLLVQTLADYRGIQAGRVLYREIKAVRRRRPTLAQLPFLKRYPFKDEREFRVIYVDEATTIESKEYEIPLRCVMKVTLSPWMPLALSNAVTATLRDIEGCQALTIQRSTLVENEKWKKVARGDDPD